MVPKINETILFWNRRIRNKNNKIRFIDPLTGIGNQLYFEGTFRHCITPANYALYYLSYISLDIQRIGQYIGGLKIQTKLLLHVFVKY